MLTIEQLKVENYRLHSLVQESVSLLKVYSDFLGSIRKQIIDQFSLARVNVDMTLNTVVNQIEVPKGWFISCTNICSDLFKSTEDIEALFVKCFNDEFVYQNIDLSALISFEKYLNHEFRVKNTSEILSQIQVFNNFVQIGDCCQESDRKVQLNELVLKKRFFLYSHKAKRVYSAFRSWVHDSRHYLERLQTVLENNWNNYLLVRDLHAAEALESALNVLKREFVSQLLDGDGYDSKVSIYEPYKLFDKFKWCFTKDLDDVVWKKEGEEFRGKLKGANGIEALVLNLYSNATKYFPRDGNEHEICTSFIKTNDGGVDISVESEGPLVPSHELNEIFKEEYRATTADVGSKSGTGWGLFRAKNICNAAGYKIRAYSIPNESSPKGWGLFRITITVPHDCFVE